MFSLRRTVLIGSRDILHFCSFTYRQHDNGVFIAGKQEGGGGTVSIPAVTIIDAEMVSSMPANLKAATGGNPRDTKLEEIKSRYREIF